jgi:hypothetical protein
MSDFAEQLRQYINEELDAAGLGELALPHYTAEQAFREGQRDGLLAARAMVMAAPTLSHGQRFSGGKGGFPGVEDRAVNPDGDPTYVHNTYALRDALLFWIDKAIAGEFPAALSTLGPLADSEQADADQPSRRQAQQ